MDLFFDNEFRSLIPPLQPDELAGLEDSLKREGNRVPVTVWKEKQIVVDGHNRYDICQRLGIVLKTPEELSFPDKDACKIWIIKNQFGRRNLSAYSRGVLALKLKELLEAKAKVKEQLRKTIQQTKPIDLAETTPVQQAIIEVLAQQPRKAPNAVPEFVYFVQNDDRVKVGCSSDIDSRLHDIVKHIPEAKLIGSCCGGRSLESEIHRLFNEHHINNEWFKLNEFTVSIIKSFLPNADFANIGKVNSTEDAVKRFDISRGSLTKVKIIEQKGTPEQKAKLLNGEDTIHGVYVKIRRQEAAQAVKEAVFPQGKYRVIYADPPWQYGNTMPNGFVSQDDHYPTMSLTAICALPVKESATDDAVLFLWVTAPMLADAFSVLAAWGFEYKAHFIWDKVKHVMGHYNSVRHELLLIAVRGSCQPEIHQLFDSVQVIERTAHSQKPAEFRTIIDTLYPTGPRLELFARQETPGWQCYGNQII